MTVPGGAGSLELDSSDLDNQNLTGQETIDTKALAKELTQKVLEGNEQPQDSRGITHEGVEGEATETPEAQAKAAQEAAQGTEGEQGGEVTYQELEDALAEAGIDLGVSAKDVPKELLPVYEKLVQSAVDVAETVLSQQLEASKALQSVKEFSEQLKSSPDKVMLALAVNQPDVYKKVAALMSDMDADPRVKEMVLRDLASEARLREAERRERAVEERDRRTRANQVIAATQRAARVYGVPFGTAEKVIALAVQANNGNLETSEVDGIVRELKGLGPAAKGKPALRVVTPQKQAAVNQANKGAVSGSEGAGTGGQGGYDPNAGTSKGLTDKSSDREGGGGRFRSLIQQINRKIASAGQ